MPLNRRDWLAGAASFFSLSALASCAAEAPDLKIGWQTPLATQGEIAAILQRTALLKENGFDAHFSAFSFGTPQMEAARADAINVALVGDQPLINLICAGADWKILCRLFDTRVSLFRNSAQPWSGPRGATFASPRGSVAHREVMFYERSKGLNPDTDVKNVFVDAAEISALLARGGNWAGIDVIAIWEPLASRFDVEPGIVKLFERKTLGVVGIDGKLASDRDAVTHLRNAIRGAWDFFLKNETQAHNWYRAVAGNQLTDALLMNVARIDRSFLNHKPDIDLTDNDKTELARSISWAREFNSQLQPVRVSDIVVP